MFTGYLVKDSTLSLGKGYPLVKAELHYNVLNGYQISEVPIAQPYGFCSLAPAKSWAFYASQGNGFNAAYIPGFTNNQEADSNLAELAAGESATFNSTNFTRQLKLDGAFDVFTGAIDNIKTAVINGGNTNEILLDLCNEIAALEEYINTFVGEYNSHVHSGVASGIETSGTTLPATPYVPSSNFTRDKTFLSATPTPNLINSDGKRLA